MPEILTRSSAIAQGTDSNPLTDNFFNGYTPVAKDSYDPYVTGYAFIKWLKTPIWLPDFEAYKALSEKNFKAFNGINDISMEVGGITAGFTATEAQYAKGISKSGEFTIKYQEQSGSPLTKQNNAWVSGIRDPKTGIATYPKQSGLEYHSSNHTGTLLYVVTRPDADNFNGGKNIEFAALFTRVMPTKIILSHFNYENGNHDFVEPEQEYKAYMHIGQAVEDFAAAYMNASRIYTFNNENNFADISSFTS
jgi:hypothetical protein